MKFLINTNELSIGLKKVCSIINEKEVKKIFKCVLLNANKNVVTLISLNSEMAIKYEIKDVTIEKEGETIFDGNILFSIISKLKAKETSIDTLDTNLVKIKAGKYVGQLNTVTEVEFPEITFLHKEADKKISLTKTLIGKIMTKIIPFSANSKNLENVKQAILLDALRTEGYLEIAATDTFQLAYFKSPYTGEKFRSVINSEVIKQIYNLSTQENFDLYLCEKKILVDWANLVFSISKDSNEKDFPPINLVDIKADYKTLIDKADLLSAIERCAAIVNGETKPFISMDFSDKTVTIESKNIEFGSSKETVDLREAIASPISFTLSLKYLLNTVKCVTSNDVIFEFNNSKPRIIFINDANEKFVKYFIAVNLTNNPKN